MKKRHIITLSLVALSVHLAAVADNNIPSGYHNGSVLSDYIHYSIGGGSAVAPPPIRQSQNAYSLGIGWKANLMCGNFSINTTVKNQLNGITEGFKDLYSNIIESATGAVASLPAMIIQRANPQLYDILSNGIYQGKIDFNRLKTSCEEMSNQLADMAMDSKLAQMASLENFKEIAAKEPDAVKAKKQAEQEKGVKGRSWIGGKMKGGKGQDPIDILKDTVGAGFNMALGRGATEKGAIAAAKCDGMLCSQWKSPEDAAQYAQDILGSKTFYTCEECGSVSSKAGRGLAPLIEKTTIEKATLLEKMLNAKNVSEEQLTNLSTSTVSVTRGLIEALREDPDAPVLGARLSQELAISQELEKALVLRRIILTGMKEPNVAKDKEAQEELEKALKQLDAEIQQVKMEMDLQRTISNNTAMTILSNRSVLQAKGLTSNASDNRSIQSLSKEAGANEVDNSKGGLKGFPSQIEERYIPIPKSEGTGLGNIYGSTGTTGNSSSLDAFKSQDAYADGRATVYRTPDGQLIKREGGTLAWRNNNPGNIKMSEWAKANGAIGVGPDGFAIFPDPETGSKAIDKLLKEGKNYRNATIKEAMYRYAPPSENNSQAYLNEVLKNTGVTADTPMSSLTDAQRAAMVETIKKVEGWKVGTETPVN